MSDKFSVRRAAQDLTERKQKVETAVEREGNRSPSVTRRSNRTVKRRGVTTSQALRSEREAKSDEGARAFGVPLNTTGAAEAGRRRNAQSTDSNNRD